MFKNTTSEFSCFHFIIDAPRITTIQNITKIIAGSGPQYIQCDVDSNPALTGPVEWYKDGSLITDTPTDNYVIRTIPGTESIFHKNVTSQLEFVDASKADSGKYSCKATNTIGSTESKTEMIVYCKLFKFQFMVF